MKASQFVTSPADAPPPVTDEFIRSMRRSCKGEDSLVEARERDHRIEKDRTQR